MGAADLPISVVIPVNNRARHLATAIRSVLNQEPRVPADIIVVDDGSTDDSADVADRLGVSVTRLPAQVGPGAARNAGVAQASQPWIAFLDADDVWLTGHCDRLWKRRGHYVLLADSGIGTLTNRVYGNGQRQPIHLTEPTQVIFPANCVQPSGVLLRTDVLQEVGGFPVTGLCEDMDTWVRVLERGHGLILPDVGWTYREHPGQLSSDREVMRAGELATVERYRSRPWFDEQIVTEVETRIAWERVMDTLHGGSKAQAARELARLGRRPYRARALMTLLRWRAGLRRSQLPVRKLRG